MQRPLLYLTLILLQCLIQVSTQDVIVAGNQEDVKISTLPSRCLQNAPLESRCKAAKRAYFYSPEVRDCMSFMYGGCGADESLDTLNQMNVFLSPQECTEVCKAGICRNNMCLMECPHGLKLDNNGCEICECKAAPNEHPPLATCQQMACPDICVNGYLFDSKGCQTCACKRADIPAVSTCQQMACPNLCKSGFILDSNGCPTCECIPTLVACQQMVCPNLCTNGYILDSEGCETCECQRKPSLPSACPEIECIDRCPRGYALDSDGCLTCNCIKQSSTCPMGPSCMMYCEHGYMLNQRGCPICKCASPPTTVQPIENECSPVACNMYCPAGGFRKDSRGCPMCECAADPCEELKCQANEICLKAVIDPSYAKCIPGRRWCSEPQCMMYCEHGFETDVYGCTECRCRASPTPLCPKVPPTCSNRCTFGHAYDSNGCETCDCLHNGCKAKDCKKDEVCAVKVHKSCPDCPVTPVCADENEVHRANVTLTYKHNTAIVRHTEDIKKQVRSSVSSMLKIPSSEITCITVRRSSDFQSTVVSFHLTISDQSVATASLQLYRRFQQDDGRQSQLLVHGVTYTPQAGTMEVVYFSGDTEAWIEGYMVEQDGYSMAIVVIAVVLICIVTAIIATICIVACKRRRHRRRSSAIYKPVDQTAMHM